MWPFNQSDVRKNEKLYDKLDAKYLDLLEEYGCETCRYYNTGNISKFTERFIYCDSCEHKSDINEIAQKLDDLDVY